MFTEAPPTNAKLDYRNTFRSCYVNFSNNWGIKYVATNFNIKFYLENLLIFFNKNSAIDIIALHNLISRSSHADIKKYGMAWIRG
jgi:hypothetical protein